MPSLITVRGKKRYRGTIVVKGHRSDKLFPDDSKDSFRAAAEWEKNRKTELKTEIARTRMAFISVEYWFQEYLDDSKDRHSVKTYQEKRSAFDRLAKLTRVTPDLPVEDITVTLCRQFLKDQFNRRSGYAANKDRKNLSAAWDWGRNNIDGWPKMKNPFRQIKKYPEVRSPRYVPTMEDFWQVYNFIEGDDPVAVQDRTMLLAFLHLAARRNEIFGLKIADLDFVGNKIRLWTRKRMDGDLEPDWLPMTQELKSALLNWLKIRMQLPGIDRDHVFICISDHPVAADFYGKPFKKRQHFMRKICLKAGIKPFGFHSIRHLTATILYHKGYKPAHIQAVLRHKSVKTTENYLQRLGLEMVRDVLEEGLEGPAKIIPFKNKLPSEGQL